MKDEQNAICLDVLVKELTNLINEHYNVPPAQIPLAVDERVREICHTLESFDIAVNIKYAITIAKTEMEPKINLNATITVTLKKNAATA